jgi:type IV secretory pathway VirB10-like protein
MQNSEFRMQTLNGRPLVLFAFFILHFALLVSLSGCSAKAKAQTLPDGPPLAVPAAPEHKIAVEQIAEAPPEPEPERVPEPVVPTPPAATTKVPPGKPQPAQTPAASQPAVTTQPAPEAPVVRAAPAASAGDEKKVRDLLTKASTDLSKRVDYQKLSEEGKEQYNQSKRFSEQAEQAIKERNFPYALSLAEKAATLAAELVR